MHPQEFIDQFPGGSEVIPLDAAWHARNKTGMARTSEQVKILQRLASHWNRPPAGWALVKFRLLGQRGRDHVCLTCRDTATTKALLADLYGRNVVWLERRIAR